MIEFIIESVEDKKQLKIEDNTKIFLGRGDLLNIHDKRCSRQVNRANL